MITRLDIAMQTSYIQLDEILNVIILGKLVVCTFKGSFWVIPGV